MTTNKAPTYRLKLVGGLNICEKKSLFSLDGKLVLTVSANSIRIYVAASGLPYGVLTTEDSDINGSEEIVAINLNPLSLDSSVISFSTRGRVVVWDYVKVQLIKEYNPFDSLYSCGNALQLVWGRAVLLEEDIQSENLNFYLAILVDQTPGLYYTSTSEIERYMSEISSKKKKTPKESKEMKQKAKQRLDESLLRVRYDPALAAVGITIGASNKFLAAITGSSIYIVSLPYKSTSRSISHRIARNNFTCITSHPKKMLLAAGDSLGRIYIYRDNFCFDNHPIRSVLHWHHSPVNDLCFSNSGAYLYSGGYECVIVRWETSMNHGNNYLPRIGSPIRFIACDTMNEKIMTSHFDNCIQFASANLDSILSSLDGLYLLPREEFLRSYGDLCYDPKSCAIVTRGKCGHLQFFSPSLEKHLFQIDVVNMNYLPPEKDKLIVNVDIDRYCISDDGEWIATLEMRDDGITLLEMRLKFWQYQEDSDRKYSLNTCVHLPHKKPVNCMRFSLDSRHLVTTSQDGYFKIWHLTSHSDKPHEKHFWVSHRIGELGRSFVPNKVAMSIDFSVLAITSSNRTTLWDISDPLELELKGSLLPPCLRTEEIINSIELGGQGKEHLLSETRETSFRTWNLLTLSVENAWQPPNNYRIKFSVFHRKTNRFGLFLSGGTLYLHGLGKDFVRIELNAPRTDINLRLMICGLFIPQEHEGDDIFSQDAVCLVDENQQIYSLGLAERDELGPVEDGLESEEGIELTPYARMLLDEKNKIQMHQNIEQIEVNQFLGHYRSRKKLVECMFTNVPSYVLPPIETLSTTFLSLLLQPDESITANGDLEDNQEADEDYRDETYSEDELKNHGMSEPMEASVLEEILPENVEIAENYDWLSSYL